MATLTGRLSGGVDGQVVRRPYRTELPRRFEPLRRSEPPCRSEPAASASSPVGVVLGALRRLSKVKVKVNMDLYSALS